MVKLSDNDINFLTKQTNLNKEKLISLIEDPADLDLILDTISKKQIDYSELKNLSFPIVTKLTVFKISKDKNFEFSEKKEVSDAIIKYFPPIIKNKRVGCLKKSSDKYSKYYLILFGYKQEINLKIMTQIENNFRLADKREFAYHLNEWIDLIKELKKEFLNTIIT